MISTQADWLWLLWPGWHLCWTLRVSSVLSCSITSRNKMLLHLWAAQYHTFCIVVKLLLILRVISRADCWKTLNLKQVKKKKKKGQDLNVDTRFLIILSFLCPDEVQEDLLSLMTVLDHWVLLIDSPDYSLGDVEGWIQKQFDCKKIELSHQYFYLESLEPSTSLLLRWCQKTTFQGELSVYSR